MLNLDSNYIKFNRMGLFDTNSTWSHPKITEITYEIIYVISGNVYIEEDSIRYALSKGELLILKPHTIHQGYMESHGQTSFYWVHFFTDDINALTNGKFLLNNIQNDFLFKEMLHHCYKDTASNIMVELLLTQLLLSNATETFEAKSKKLIKDVFEWTRINATSNLKVTDIANRFDYSEDHLSRLIKTEYGKNLKQLISGFVTEKAKGMLLNTNFSVKEISAALDFEDTNNFLKFFKYHVGKTPSEYRNKFNATYMNKF